MDVSTRSTDQGYARTAIWLHWIIAALIILNLVLGLYHEDVGREARAAMMSLHKATGLLILALSLGRLAWRIGHRPPAFDPVMRRWETALAGTLHWLFYLFLIAIPLTGWMLTSTSGKPVDIFGLFEIGALPVSRSKDAHEFFEEAHEILGKAMIGLIALHVLGALKHHFEGNRQIFGRMAPWFYRGR